MTTTTTTASSPSAARRQALREADHKNSTYKVVETFPVESYFDLTKRLLKEFELAVNQRELDAAYIYGIRFATFSLEALPKHRGYKNVNQQLRQVNAKQVEQVLLALEDVTARMDAEEVAAERQRVQQVAIEAKKAAAVAAIVREEEEKEEARRRRQLEQEEAEAKQKRVISEDSKETRLESIQKSAMAKLLAMQQNHRDDVTTTTTAATATTSSTSTATNPQQPPQQEKPAAIASARYRTTSSRSPHRTPSKPPDKSSTANATSTGRSALDSLPTLTMMDPSSSNNKNNYENKPSSSQSIMSDGLCPDEERTIRLLQTTIARQEARWPALEQMAGQLRVEAKECLAQSNRRGAIGKLAQRQRVLRAVQAAKTSIFTMETQIMRIEAAASDRDVQAAMRKASDTMAELHAVTNTGRNHNNNVDVLSNIHDDFTELSEVNHVLAHTDLLDTYDDDELLRELLGGGEETALVHEEQNGHVGPSNSTTTTSNLLALPTLPSSQSKVQENKKQPIMATIV